MALRAVSRLINFGLILLLGSKRSWRAIWRKPLTKRPLASLDARPSMSHDHVSTVDHRIGPIPQYHDISGHIDQNGHSGLKIADHANRENGMILYLTRSWDALTVDSSAKPK